MIQMSVLDFLHQSVYVVEIEIDDLFVLMDLI